jgi:hypothetical protein
MAFRVYKFKTYKEAYARVRGGRARVKGRCVLSSRTFVRNRGIILKIRQLGGEAEDMNSKLSMMLALVVLGLLSAASIYAWQMVNKPPESELTEFKVVVNGLRELDVLVHVNVNDGLTREEAEQIAEETFIQVMGEKVVHRLDKLTLNENSMEAHYTWGIDESDMGHVFDMTGDITSRSITVTHCR